MLLVVADIADKSVRAEINNFAVKLHRFLNHGLGIDRHKVTMQLLDFNRFSLQKVNVRIFMLIQENQGFTVSASTGCSTNPMHELVRPLRRIKLNNPIHVGDIDTSGSEISSDQQFIDFCLFLRFELLVNMCAFFLINFTVKLPNLFHIFLQNLL